MSESKMTPGPWTFDYLGNSTAAVYCKRQNRIGQRFTMATVEAFSPDETEANARAIAALPELIEAARSGLDLLDSLSASLEHATDCCLEADANCNCFIERDLPPVLTALRRILARIDNGGDNG